MGKFVWADDDLDDPIVWQYGVSYPDGQNEMKFRVLILRESARSSLVAAFGEAWLANYLAEKERDMASWGMN